MSGSNTTGIYADYRNNFYNFTYNCASSTMSSSTLISSFIDSFSPTFSADNRRLILTANFSITLYSVCYIANCANLNSSGYCLTCTSGYYSPNLNCTYQCNRNCLTCSNSSTCDTCISSSPSRVLSLF
jgi:hypothetical protein